MAKEVKEKSTVNPNKTISMSLLDSYRKVLYQIKIFFDSIDFENIEDLELKIKTAKSILDAGKVLGDNIRSLDILEEKVKKEEKENSVRKGGAETSLFEM
jgi:hypothetical protein